MTILIAGPPIGAQQSPRFAERVDVTRIVVDARVLDDRDNPVLGLTAQDFKVSIDGKSGRVETATWVGGHDTYGDDARQESTQPSDADVPPDMARHIVFLFQKDLRSSRIVDLMRMLLERRNLLATLTPNDRVAILSFDSHLKIWTDFTNDRERLDRLLGHSLLFETPQPEQASSTPSLMSLLDRDAGRRTYGIERALELIGEALEPLPGSKSLVLIGYGFGQFSRAGFSIENDYYPTRGLVGLSMQNDYYRARDALVASRTSVFSLDVTDARYHSFEQGLQLVSDQTGGFYARTSILPDVALRRLSGALAGYYVLLVERPESQRAVHDIKVQLTRGKGRVLAARSYSERDR